MKRAVQESQHFKALPDATLLIQSTDSAVVPGLIVIDVVQPRRETASLRTKRPLSKDHCLLCPYAMKHRTHWPRTVSSILDRDLIFTGND